MRNYGFWQQGGFKIDITETLVMKHWREIHWEGCRAVDTWGICQQTSGRGGWFGFCNCKIISLYYCSIIERQCIIHYTNHGFISRNISRNISCPGIEGVTKLGCSPYGGYWLCSHFPEESLMWHQEQKRFTGEIQQQFCFQRLKLLVKSGMSISASILPVKDSPCTILNLSKSKPTFCTSCRSNFWRFRSPVAKPVCSRARGTFCVLY